MRILYIWDSDYPWDIRVEKICTTLQIDGHDVHIAARNLKKLPEVESINGLYVHRMKTWNNNKLNFILSFPVFFSPFWRRFLDKIISDNNIDLIIVRDLPMAIAGLWAGKRNNIPVIFDMAEDYVAMIWNIWKYGEFKVINFVVRNPYLARCIERYVFSKVNHTFVVIEEAINVVIRGGGNRAEVTVVGNTPPLSAFNSSDTQMNGDLKVIQKRFSAIYTGGIQMGRGIQTVLDALPDVIREIPDFLLVVLGGGYATNQLKQIIEDRRLQDHVLWLGWIDHHKIFDYIKVSKIGLIPHFVTDHVNTTIPNKLFDYMGCGIPVIASDAVPIKRILTEEKCGIFFKSGEARDLARAILKVYNTDFDYGRNGIEAVKRKYNWEKDGMKMLKVVNEIC